MKALQHIESQIGPVLSRSSIYESEAWGKKDQDDFLNMAVILKTNLSPGMLLKEIKNIEGVLGRVKSSHWGPREIDIDIIFYGNQCINESDLIVPHVELSNRNFVLIPIMEIAGDKMDPKSKLTVEELYISSEDAGEVWFYNYN